MFYIWTNFTIPWKGCKSLTSQPQYLFLSLPNGVRAKSILAASHFAYSPALVFPSPPVTQIDIKFSLGFPNSNKYPDIPPEGRVENTSLFKVRTVTDSPSATYLKYLTFITLSVNAASRWQANHATAHQLAPEAWRPRTNSGSLRLARMFPFSPADCLLGLFTRGELSKGGGGGGGGGATFSLLGEIVSSNHCPRIGSLSSSNTGGRKNKHSITSKHLKQTTQVRKGL